MKEKVMNAIKLTIVLIFLVLTGVGVTKIISTSTHIIEQISLVSLFTLTSLIILGVLLNTLYPSNKDTVIK